MDELKKLLQERVTNGERVVEETHDENKRNVNHDSIDSNVGSKTHHVPKIDMRKFDGKDPTTWILQMEQFFDLNNVQNPQKVRMATLYLEPVMKPAQEKIEKIYQRLRIQPLRGGNLLYIT